MKRYCLLAFLVFSFIAGFAQNISVKSFRALPTDMTASSKEGKRIDQNGDVAALIKVMTTEKGFVFEGGSLGIVDTQQRVGEIWVWVPRGLRKITVLHQQLGGLRDYRFPVEIEAERTYEMVLVTGKVETIVKEEVRQQYLAFELTPPNAILEVNDQLWEVDDEGNAMQFVNFGTYSYRVRAANYHTEAGRVTVDNPDNTTVVKVALNPDFAQVTLKVDADAEIWVNNEKKGVRTWTGPLGRGVYKIECKRASHETVVVSKEISPEMSGQTIDLPSPKPIYGSLNVESTPKVCKVFIDGQDMGNTPKSLNEILIGQHTLKLAKEGYADYTETVTIAKGERKQVKATLSKKSNDDEGLIVNNMLKTDETFTVNGVSFTMKLVEGGTFQMGATKEQGSDAYDDEKPVHSVTLSTYYMGETEVTQALWQAVMGSNPSNWKGDDLPVERVSWNDIQLFIRILNKKTGKNFRLPTEAEWEYAARGGKKSGGYKYAGGKSIGKVAWYDGNSGKKTHPVKTKLPNELGLYDMSGNVYEWCQDWQGDYSSGSQTNPTGPSSGSFRVLRGGSWYAYTRFCRVSVRDYLESVSKDSSYGFRLALSYEDNNTSENEETFTVNGVSFTMKPVEGGTFQMGATSEVASEANEDEYPAHDVTVSDYYIGETEVTQALWQAVMGTTIRQQVYKADESWPLRGEGGNYPMYCISWNECLEFIRKLNQITGKNFRLPTEAEWEYAARGGKNGKGNKYAGSNTLGNVAWYFHNCDQTHPVKTKSPNELGLYDMSGNVYEWCSDWYGSDYYWDSPSTDPQGPSAGTSRVLRGGGWGHYAWACRVSYRLKYAPTDRYIFLGFRLALTQ